MERSVIGLFLGDAASVSEDDIRLTFSALKRLVDVLPYTLGVLIAASFLLGVLQARGTGWRPLSVLVLIILAAPMFYNIVLADTALVVSNLKSTAPGDDLTIVQKSLRDAALQHFIGFVAFLLALTVQALHILVGVRAPGTPS